MAQKKPNVAFVRSEAAKLMPQYTLIRDAVSGEVSVKAAGTKYLPMPKGVGDKKEESERYLDYKMRAVFYNVARRTLMGLVGHVFSKAPEVKMPPSLDIVEKNADGAGVDLIQQSKQALMYTLAYSRAGLLVDYPKTEGAVTKADLDSGRVRPTIAVYTPQEIINWRVEARGAEDVLTLVVLAETYQFDDDGFEVKDAQQYRVLRLDGGVYTQEIWREKTPTVAGSNGEKSYVAHETLIPTGADGNPINEIPFTFIGSINNNSNPDSPNFYDLASLNIAHYRNSADYEESCYVVGQPTAVATGLDEHWVKEVLGGEIDFGSRGGIPLPAGAALTLVQATPNTMIKEAMDTKERQMVALGAKLVEQKNVQRTAFEAGVDAANEGSTLASSAENVSSAYQWALGWCAKFVGQDDSGIVFKLNTDFDLSKMSPEEQKQSIDAWQKGAIAWPEMRESMRKAGLATLDDAEAKEEIAQDTALVPQQNTVPKTSAPLPAKTQRNPIGA